MSAVVVLVPLLALAARRARFRARSAARASRSDWIDGLLTTGRDAGSAGAGIPADPDLAAAAPTARCRPTSSSIARRATGPGPSWPFRLASGCSGACSADCFPKSRFWGTERPALEIWTAILAFAPVVGWLGNPAWWRETLPRLAHYYTLSNQRRGALPDIQIIYFGQIYEYSLPWHNAWVLMGITVPAAILGAAAIGLLWALRRIRRDRLPLYFLIHLLTLPVIRMFETPAHDGVRLFLPTFFFLAAFAGWGTIWLADALARRARAPVGLLRLAVSGVVVGSAAARLDRRSPLRAFLLQRADRRPARGLGARLRADLLVRRLQRPGDPRAERQAAAPGRGRLPQREDQSPSRFRSSRPWERCARTSCWSRGRPTSFLTSGS